MTIQFDAQLLLETQKTGIGQTAQKIIEFLAINNKEHTYILNYFALLYPSQKRSLLERYIKLGCKPNECKWFNSTIYKLLYSFVPVPYSLFFGHDADITHFMNYHVPPGVKGKVVTMVYDMVYKVFPETMNYKTRYMLEINMKRSCKRADIIVTISQFSKSEIIKYLNIPPEKIAVMPCGVDFHLFRPDYDEEDVIRVKNKLGIAGDYFLYLGTLEPRKNIERLIEAYNILKNRIKDVPSLVIAGKKGWLYDAIFQKVNNLGLSRDIIFTGYVSETDAPILMKGASAFMFPSIYEGFGLPPLEAMACGTPVITSNTASLPEVVGDAAILTDPFSVESIADAMEQIITKPSLRLQLSQMGLKRAAAFTWDRSARIISEIYDSLAKK